MMIVSIKSMLVSPDVGGQDVSLLRHRDLASIVFPAKPHWRIDYRLRLRIFSAIPSGPVYSCHQAVIPTSRFRNYGFQGISRSCTFRRGDSLRADRAGREVVESIDTARVRSRAWRPGT